jgi:formylmethanofuran dehydrogenase subunit D
MCTKQEIKTIAEKFELELKELELKELELKTTFFPPNYIPKRYCSNVIVNSKGKEVGIPLIKDVVLYLKTNAYKRNKVKKNNTLSLFDSKCKNSLVSCHY